VLQTMSLLNPAYYVSTHKSANWASHDGMVPDVGDPTGAFQMTLSKLPHPGYGSHHLVLELCHQKLVTQNPELHEPQNLLIETHLCLLATWLHLDAVDRLESDGLGMDPQHKSVKYLGIHILEDVCLRLSFLKSTSERRLEDWGRITCKGCKTFSTCSRKAEQACRFFTYLYVS
jgi:hypothetical protein